VSAVGLALLSAALFGSMSVALRFALRRRRDPEAGALATALVALVPCGVIAVAGGEWGGELWPFLLAGLLAPGASQTFYVFAVRDLGPSRAAVLVGMAPLVSVTIALVFLDEPLTAPLVSGALLIVLGGVALAGERVRPETFRGIGALYAVVCTVFFATRDNVVRALATGTDVPPQLAASLTIVAGATVMGLYLLARRGGRRAVADTRLALRPFALAGLVWGLSYASLFEAFYRGRVSVVSPLVATESLFGVLFAALFVGRSELVGRHVVIGAALIVAGGMLIGAFR
jgi:drug/metabolite transporter (DMT)-like permease